MVDEPTSERLAEGRVLAGVQNERVPSLVDLGRRRVAVAGVLGGELEERERLVHDEAGLLGGDTVVELDALG